MPVGLLSFAATPSHNGQRIQVGMTGVDYFNPLPFANLWKSANWPIVTAGGTDYNANLGPGKSTSPWGVYLDASGDLASPMSGTITEYRRLWYENATATVDASLIGRNMVLVFTGTATTVSFDGSPTSVSRVGNRVTFTVASDGTNRIKFSGFSNLDDPPKVTYLCFAEDESAVLSNPYALTTAYRQDMTDAGVVRFMDPISINSNRVTNTISDFPDVNYCKWGATGYEGGLKAGIPLAAIVNICNTLKAHCHFNMPNRVGVAKTGRITGFTNANPAVVSAYPLPANGDEVIFCKMGGLTRTFSATANATTDILTSSGNHNLVENQAGTFTGSAPSGLNPGGSRTAYYFKVLSATTFQLANTRGGAAIDFTTNGGALTFTVEVECDKFTVANVNSGAGTFELSGPGSDTTLLSAFSANSQGNQWMTQFDFNALEDAMTPILEYFRDNLSTGLQLRLAYGNEVFNSGNNFDHFWVMRSQARYTNVRTDSQSTMHGYMTGFVCHLANQVFGPSGRTRWKGLAETHTANTAVTGLIITGLGLAITDFAPTLAIDDLIDCCAISSYYAESLIASANNTTLQTWIDDSQAANISNPGTYPTQYTLFVQRMGTQAYDGSVTTLATDSVYINEVKALWVAHQNLFAAQGVSGITQYEGGQHIVVSSSLSGEAELIDFVVQYYGSQVHATNITQLLAEWDTMTNADFPSQYLSHYFPSRFGGWGLRNYIGVDTPVSDVYQAYNAA